MSLTAPLCVAVFLAASAAPAAAQVLGIGGRMSMIRGDVQADTSAERFTGGLVRAKLSPRSAIELALDMRTQSNEAQTERIKDYPLQGSLLLYPVRSTLAPYLLGGLGWYSHRVEQLADGKVIDSESRRRFGYHAGFGADLQLGRHAAVHADYRYTLLRFGSDDDDADGASAVGLDGGSVASRFLPSYEGSMWTAGVTVYF
jgi:opacity protein-like surface antigen